MTMKWSTAVLVGAAASVVLLVAALRLGRKRQLKITTEDLGYQEHSPEELASHHLLDLNTASHEELQRLGLNDEMTDKIVDNRPYRNKLDLLSRMVIPEATYNGIRSLIGIAGATQSIKIAG
jgi:DNA uptake protein ComE-like DNA-binding protein